jgi:uncharacterized membrane protein
MTDEQAPSQSPVTFDWRFELPQLLVLAATWIAAAVSWPTAPDRIPVHWNIEGEIDRHGGKLEGLLLLPLLCLVFYLLLYFLPRIDPGRANYPQFKTAYGVIRLAVMLVFGAITAMMHLTMRGVAVDVGRMLPLVLGVMFLLLGGVLGKVRPNWFVGVRTPWTLSSKTAWVRTHRIGGGAFMLAGLVVIAASLLSARAAFFALITTLPGVALGLVAYSYFAWRDSDDKQPPAGTRPA